MVHQAVLTRTDSEQRKSSTQSGHQCALPIQGSTTEQSFLFVALVHFEGNLPFLLEIL